MIIDTLANLKQYYALNSKLKIVSEFLATTAIDTLEKGRHEIRDGVFVLVMEYSLKNESEALWEAHRRNYDVQLVTKGSEKIGYAEISTMTNTNEYVDKDDYQLFTGNATNYVNLSPGTFVLLAPQDVHKTSMFIDHERPSEDVRKIVFKVPVIA